MTTEQITLLLTNYGPMVLTILSTISMACAYIRKMKKLISRYENNDEMKTLKKDVLKITAYSNKIAEENAALLRNIDVLQKQLKEEKELRLKEAELREAELKNKRR